jgi:CIC family chloride channel protein
LLSIVALLVGLASGAGVWLFKRLIGWSGELTAWAAVLLAQIGSLVPALTTAAGGLAVGLIVHFFVGEERHHGVAGIMEAAALAGGRLRFGRMPVKVAAAAVGIGSGAAVGPEDPSVQIGSNIGSFAGQRLRMSDERLRALVAAGGAAGIAAAFNAPIAGVFFALEILLGEIGGNALGIVVVASVASAVFTQAVEGAQPAFQIPPYAFGSPWELPLYFGLGLLAGPVAALYVRLLYSFQDLFHRLQAPRWLKPALAGLVVGLVGVFLPQVLGVGYETIEAILEGQDLGFWLLLSLLTAKIVLTPVSIGGGFMGGVFAPSLFLGATLGGAWGLLAERFFPALGVDPAAFAMVGMAAVLAGAVHAPLTAILLLFEMTNDYRIILPLMFAVAVSLTISQRLQSDSVYTLGLRRKGIRLERGKDVEVLQAIKVVDVMEKEFPRLRETDSLAAAWEILLHNRRHGLPVMDRDGRLAGIFTLQDVDRAGENERPERTVGEFCTRDLITCYPDETIGEVLRSMSPQDIGRLPVVDRTDPRRLVGLLRRSDVIRAYDLALAQRASVRHLAHQVRLGAYGDDGVQVIEQVVEAGSACAGRAIKEITWPGNSVIASLRRGRRLIVPRGETILKAGDILVVVSNDPVEAELVQLCMQQDAGEREAWKDT